MYAVIVVLNTLIKRASVDFLVVLYNPAGMVCLRDGSSELAEEQAQAQEASRLQSLSAFQLRCLTHALQFPQVQRVVYSTCSIHTEENEQVVAACLQQNPNFRYVHLCPSYV